MSEHWAKLQADTTLVLQHARKRFPSDFAADGVRSIDSGRGKVARLLLEYFATEPLASGWFARP
jgi:hypothetical protein